MTLLQTFHLAHLPPDLAVHVALFTDVQNAPFLRDQLLQGNPDFEYALIDASVIISTTHVLAAVFRAANDQLHSRLKSRNVHSEIVFSLGANNNIAQSLRAFGISPTTTHLLAIKLSTTPNPTTTTTPPTTAATVTAHLTASVTATAVEFCDAELARMADVGRIRQLYKLGGGAEMRRRRKDGSVEGSGGGAGGGEREGLEVAVLGLMALRGAV